jgi:hypothetical protein
MKRINLVVALELCTSSLNRLLNLHIKIPGILRIRNENLSQNDETNFKTDCGAPVCAKKRAF